MTMDQLHVAANLREATDEEIAREVRHRIMSWGRGVARERVGSSVWEDKAKNELSLARWENGEPTEAELAEAMIGWMIEHE